LKHIPWGGYIDRMQAQAKTSVSQKTSAHRRPGCAGPVAYGRRGFAYCIDIVTQLSAVWAALARPPRIEVMRDHAAPLHRGTRIASGNQAEQRRKVAEVDGRAGPFDPLVSGRSLLHAEQETRRRPQSRPPGRRRIPANGPDFLLDHRRGREQRRHAALQIEQHPRRRPRAPARFLRNMD